MSRPRCEDDFYAWTQYQAQVLRSLRVSDNRFDREQVAEEIEELGKSERDAARSQVRRIVEHLLKLGYPPAQQPRFDWIDTIIDARQRLADTLTPALRRDIEVALQGLYEDGRRRAEASFRRYGEADAIAKLPADCPYSLEDICRADWYPAGP